MTMLRYPGGKSRLVKHILPYLEPYLQECSYAEVMTGGSNLALKIGQRFPKKSLLLNDADADVANFWAVVCEQEGAAAFEALCACVEQSRRETDDKERGFDYWRKVKASKPESLAERAFRFVFLNKTTYGGQVDASPVGGYSQTGWAGSNGRKVYCQYNVDNILKELRKAHAILQGRTKVKCQNALDLLPTLGPAWLPYIDPPYFPGKENKLYRFQMPLEQHEALAAFLSQWNRPWVLSYDEHPTVRKLYAWAKVFVLLTKYSHGPGPSKKDRLDGKRKTWKESSEIIVLPTIMQTTSPSPAPVDTVAAPPPAKTERAAKKQMPQPDIRIRVKPRFVLWGSFDDTGCLLVNSMSPDESQAALVATQLNATGPFKLEITISDA